MHYRPIALGLAFALAFCVGSIVGASAQPVTRIIVGVPPGANLDALARLIADKLASGLQSSVIVENRPGAGSALANLYVKTAPNDGSTFLIGPISAMTVFPHTHPNVGYDPFRDFTPVISLAKFKYALGVGTSVSADTFGDYVEALKKDSKLGMFGSAGVGSPTHFYGLLFGKKVGAEMTHIPYRGTSAVLVAVMGGELPAAFVPLGDIGKLAKNKKAKILAILDTERSAEFPDVPTFEELGFNFDESGQYLMYAPAGTPEATIDRVAMIVKKSLSDPQLRARLSTMDLEPTGYDATEVLSITHKSYDTWGPIIRQSGVKMQN